MDTKHQSIFIISLLALSLMLIYYLHVPKEYFATKRTKAQAIYDWFQNNPQPAYVNYRRDLSGASNIVEYEDVLNLFQNRNLTVDSVEKII